jgi:hypothetical protein
VGQQHHERHLQEGWLHVICGHTPLLLCFAGVAQLLGDVDGPACTQQKVQQSGSAAQQWKVRSATQQWKVGSEAQQQKVGRAAQQQKVGRAAQQQEVGGAAKVPTQLRSKQGSCSLHGSGWITL